MFFILWASANLKFKLKAFHPLGSIKVPPSYYKIGSSLGHQEHVHIYELRFFGDAECHLDRICELPISSDWDGWFRAQREREMRVRFYSKLCRPLVEPTKSSEVVHSSLLGAGSRIGTGAGWAPPLVCETVHRACAET